MIRMFIGYDGKETVAYHVLSHSILSRATAPVSVAPLMLSQLKDTFSRERNALQSTEFAFSRFLVPYLSGYEGWSIFMDCDMLVLDDMKNLWDLRDDKYAVMCVKHDYTPKTGEKFLGQVQTTYEKKNWSSVMMFNNAKCRALTPEYVNTATGLELHRFRWLGDDNLIGEIPLKWNYLVGEYEKIPAEQISNLHYTLGGPYFSSYKDTDYADVWIAERERLLHAAKDVSLVNNNKPKEPQVPLEEQFRWVLVSFDSGNMAEASSKCKAILKQDENYGDALNLMGVISFQEDDLNTALEWFKKANKVGPDNPSYTLNLGMLCKAMGDKEGAKQALDATLAVSPGNAQAFQIRLKIALDEEDYVAAERVLKNLLPVVPAAPDLLTLLIAMLYRQEKYYETLPYFEELIRMQKVLSPELTAHYGLALMKHGRPVEAIPQLTKAIEHGYNSPEAFSNLAIAYDQIGEHEKSLHYYDICVKQYPDFILASGGRLLLKIKMANLKSGIEIYRDRWPINEIPKRFYPMPEWRGEPLQGKKILLWSEQGVGDIVMFSGFLPYIEKQAAVVALEMEQYLYPLMKRSFPNIEMVMMEEKSSAKLLKKKWDYHCSIADLMELCLPKYEPREVHSYLKPDPEQVKRLRSKYSSMRPGFKVGLSWQTIIEKNSYVRNIPFMQWLPLITTPNCHFVSLQYMDLEESIRKVAPAMNAQNIPITIDPEVDSIRDKDAWAAQIAAMDMVISIQNSTVHFAGALGVDTMILLSKCSDWRWGLTNKDSPFYSSVQIVRQQTFGDWKPVLDQARAGLGSRMKLAKAG